MLNAIASAARITVGRDCALAAIGIVGLMAYALDDVLYALRLGAWAFLGLSLLLWLRAALAMLYPYQRTDVWHALADEHRPNERFAQQLIGRAIRGASLQMALLASWLAAALLVSSVLIGLTGQDQWLAMTPRSARL